MFLMTANQLRHKLKNFSQTKSLAQTLPWTSTPEVVRSLFERHGRVLDVELSMYNKTRNRGLAFVEMASEEEALAALNSLESYARLREAASLEKHVLLKKLRALLESLKGRVVGRNKEGVEDAIAMTLLGTDSQACTSMGWPPFCTFRKNLASSSTSKVVSQYES